VPIHTGLIVGGAKGTSHMLRTLGPSPFHTRSGLAHSIGRPQLGPKLLMRLPFWQPACQGEASACACALSRTARCKCCKCSSAVVLWCRGSSLPALDDAAARLEPWLARPHLTPHTSSPLDPGHSQALTHSILDTSAWMLPCLRPHTWADIGPATSKERRFGLRPHPQIAQTTASACVSYWLPRYSTVHPQRDPLASRVGPCGVREWPDLPARGL
jgi:hypothetical protein